MITTKSAAIAFFSSPPFFLLALSFSPFFFLRMSDFQALPFLSQIAADFVMFVFKKFKIFLRLLLAEIP